MAGTGLESDTLLPVFSSSKGAIGIVVGLLLDRGLLDLDAAVASYWPEFAAAGKSRITVRQLLSHQAGLLGVDGGFSYAEVYGHDRLAARLAAQRPLWSPGTAHAYHALTIGTLADELVRRITGHTLSAFFAAEVAGPRGLDVLLGTPASEDHRVETVDLPPEVAGLPPDGRLYAKGSYDAASLPTDPVPLWIVCNREEFRRAASPAANGCATAAGLAAMYCGLRHDIAGPRLLSDEAIGQLSQLQVAGNPLNKTVEQRFGVVFMKPTATISFGSDLAYGHDGAAGSLAFDDPEWDIAVGYSVKRLPLPGGADRRALALAATLRTCVDAL